MAQYDPDWVRAYYDEYGEKEWQRWDTSPVEQAKLEVHLYYLRRYLQAHHRILEIGAGPGRFTQQLAKIAEGIVVADISPVQLQLNRENAHALGFADFVERWVECDMCDLRSHFDKEAFDAIVCYGGPLSYVFDEREEALQEMLHVTAPGGLLFLGVMSLWGTIHHFLPYAFKVAPKTNWDIIESGDLGPDSPASSSHFCHLYRAAELEALLEKEGFIIQVLSASNCLSATWGEHLHSVQEDGDAWRHLLEMEIRACREPGCRDMGTHLIAVCQKPA